MRVGMGLANRVCMHSLDPVHTYDLRACDYDWPSHSHLASQKLIVPTSLLAS